MAQSASAGVVLPSVGVVEEYAADGTYAQALATATDYFHYGNCGENDGGWGCAYRCLQMILSNLILFSRSNPGFLAPVSPHIFPTSYQSSLTHPNADRWELVPSIFEIQITLAKIGRMEEHDIGSQRWIEPPDAGAYLEYCNIQGRNTTFLANNPMSINSFQRSLTEHFNIVKTPVMIDDRIQAFCLLGIQFRDPNQPTRITHLLRFDPHVFGYPLCPESARKGALWLPFEEVFKPHVGRVEWLVLFPSRDRIQ